MARPSRRTVTLLAILVAAVGLLPLADVLSDRGNPDAAAAAALGAELPKADPQGDALATAERPVVVVLARTEDWVKYIDLVIRVLAVVLAWFLGSKPAPAPATPPAPARHG